MVMREVIYVVVMEDVDLGIKRLDTLIFVIVDKMLMVMVEVRIGLRPSTLPPITQFTMLDCCVDLFLIVVLKMFLVMKEVIAVVMTEDMDLCLKI